MNDSQNTLPTEQKIFNAVLAVGLTVMFYQFVLIADSDPLNDLWDGTMITFVIAAAGVGFVVSCLVENRQLRVDEKDIETRGEGGFWESHLAKVKSSTLVGMPPWQDGTISRLRETVHGRRQFPEFMGKILTALGMIGTMIGSKNSFGGMKQTLLGVGEGINKVDMSGVSTTFSGLEQALVSSIVALLMGSWISALCLCNKGLAVRLLNRIAERVEEEVIATANVPSQETVAIKQVAAGIEVVALKHDDLRASLSKELSQLRSALNQSNTKLEGMTALQRDTNLQQGQQFAATVSQLSEKFGDLGTSHKQLVKVMEQRVRNVLYFQEGTEAGIRQGLEDIREAVAGIKNTQELLEAIAEHLSYDFPGLFQETNGVRP